MDHHGCHDVRKFEAEVNYPSIPRVVRQGMMKAARLAHQTRLVEWLTMQEDKLAAAPSPEELH